MSAKHTYEILWRSQAIDKTYLEHRELVLLKSSTLLIQVVKIERGHHVPLPLMVSTFFWGKRHLKGGGCPIHIGQQCAVIIPFLSGRSLYASFTHPTKMS